jgi:hypothetical protein
MEPEFDNETSSTYAVSSLTLEILPSEATVPLSQVISSGSNVIVTQHHNPHNKHRAICSNAAQVLASVFVNENRRHVTEKVYNQVRDLLQEPLMVAGLMPTYRTIQNISHRLPLLPTIVVEQKVGEPFQYISIDEALRSYVFSLILFVVHLRSA